PAQVATTGRIDAQPLSDGRLRLRFVAPDGTPAAALTGMLELAALTGNWRARQGFTTDAEGMTADSYDLRARLPLVVTTRDATLRDRPAGFAPLVLEEIR
ncbi:hypothetical protein, partial [Paracoccus liaowanqingii]|uniref:hypothetical protein n=1 Tax=Paracoccus liaowanqingii TaxID=2560053 RepID=UPI00143DBB64